MVSTITFTLRDDFFSTKSLLPLPKLHWVRLPRAPFRQLVCAEARHYIEVRRDGLATGSGGDLVSLLLLFLTIRSQAHLVPHADTMAKRKRSHPPPTNPSPRTLTHTLPSEAPTATLPDELLDIVLRIACQGPGEDVALPDIDFKTTLAITLVSKSTYNYTIPLLYAHVRLTRPSDLLLYVRTVSTQPSLATYTKTLWIGPDDVHIEQRSSWPLNKDCTGMRSSIADPAMLPIGVEVGTYWSLTAEATETESRIDADARNFLQKACRRVGDPKLGKGINLQSGGKNSFDGKVLPTREAHHRVYQVQQGFDSFLHRVRQKQDARQSHGHISSTPLRLFPAFDRFDHPVMYDRTESAPTGRDDDWTSIQRTEVFDGPDYLVQIADPYDESDTEQPSSDEDPHEHLRDPLLFICDISGAESTLNLAQIICDQVASGQPTMGALIVLSRVILERSHQLLSLALTSYLQSAVFGADYGAFLDRVHLLTLGPPGQRYQMPLNLNHQGLDSVVRLRLWGEEEGRKGKSPCS